MKQRIITALILAPLVLLGVLFLPTQLLAPLVAAALLGGLWEWTRLIGIQSLAGRGLVLALHAALMAWLAWKGWPVLFPWLVLSGVAAWLLIPLWLLRPGFGAAPTPLNTGLKLIAGSLLTLPPWAAFGLLHAEGEIGPRWALYALLIVWAADTFAYFAGRRFGQRKLAPSISPGKTWAGFCGGLFGVLILALVMAPVLRVPLTDLPTLIGISLVTGLASVIGDLFESLIKRQAGVKDSGSLLPGHGGLLDRIDSLLAALPIFALLKLGAEL